MLSELVETLPGALGPPLAASLHLLFAQPLLLLLDDGSQPIPDLGVVRLERLHNCALDALHLVAGFEVAVRIRLGQGCAAARLSYRAAEVCSAPIDLCA